MARYTLEQAALKLNVSSGQLEQMMRAQGDQLKPHLMVNPTATYLKETGMTLLKIAMLALDKENNDIHPEEPIPVAVPHSPASKPTEKIDMLPDLEGDRQRFIEKRKQLLQMDTENYGKLLALKRNQQQLRLALDMRTGHSLEVKKTRGKATEQAWDLLKLSAEKKKANRGKL